MPMQLKTTVLVAAIAVSTIAVMSCTDIPSWTSAGTPYTPDQGESLSAIATPTIESTRSVASDDGTIREGTAAPANSPSEIRSGDNSGWEPVWSPDGNRIAFASDRDGDWEIYVTASDGSSLTRITENSDDDSDPTWSPDGRFVAFVSNRDGNDEIYVANSDGAGPARRITDDPAADWDPAWSPDGSTIVFSSNRPSGPYRYLFFELYSVNADGYGVTQLTELESYSFEPAWSTDGRRIVFQRRGGIYMMTADGSRVWQIFEDPDWNRRNLNARPRHDHKHPTWSPDGDRIAYSSIREDGTVDIYSMSASGSGVRRLTDSPGSEWHASWSPDGQRIAFVSSVGGRYGMYIIEVADALATPITVSALDALRYASQSEKPASDPYIVDSDLPSGYGHDWNPDGQTIVYGYDGEIYIVKSDGSFNTRLTYNSDLDYSPKWLPDGIRFSFASNRGGSPGCWIMRADGSDLSQVVVVPENSGSPCPEWSPDGTKIVFHKGWNGAFGIHVSDQHGTAIAQLTDTYGDREASWSPDGSRIAFTRWHGGDFGSREIYTIDVDGTNLKRITNNEFDDRNPVWSTDGRNLAFDSNRSGAYSIFIVGSNGSNAIALESNVTRLSSQHSYSPKWLPDGKNLAFSSDRNGANSIFIANVQAILEHLSPISDPLVAIKPHATP